MNSAETIALSKVIKEPAEKKARADLSPGTYPVDVTVRISGTLTVGADTEKVPTASIPTIETLALALRLAGFSREKAKAVMVETLHKAIAETGKGAGALANDPEWGAIVEEAKKHVQEVLSSLPKTPVKGSVRTELEVAVVESAAQVTKLAA